MTSLHPSRRPPIREWRRCFRRLADALRAAPPPGYAFAHREVGVALVDDPLIARMNFERLRHRGPTDILTFDYGDGSGELVISLDTAAREAAARRLPLRREVSLYVAHGLLHLAGMEDRTPAHRHAMRRAERALLTAAGL
ncbi:MAG: rRNA maturation RNase YbeY [Verrucomicrobiae bacterium]|nr:rRNA maturation RNase YbeY [Verrucomicrobiae bacterium]